MTNTHPVAAGLCTDWTPLAASGAVPEPRPPPGPERGSGRANPALYPGTEQPGVCGVSLSAGETDITHVICIYTHLRTPM